MRMGMSLYALSSLSATAELLVLSALQNSSVLSTKLSGPSIDYRATNGIFAKIGRLATEEVIVQH